MEMRRKDGPPAREDDEIPYDRRERCLFNPFVQGTRSSYEETASQFRLRDV
jgi:hypothetical protein